MDTPPIPKPRSAFLPQNDPLKRPVPLPRTKVPPHNDKVTTTDIFRSISTVSKQISEDVALKVSTSAKSANEKIEKSLIDGSKFAKNTIEKTITTSRAVRDSVTKSVIEGTRTAGLRLRRSRKTDNVDEVETERCVSMPVVDVSLFDNIQFHSPLLEQKRFNNENDKQMPHDLPSLNLNSSHLDDLSLFSNNSDSNTDTVSNFSQDSRESDQLNEQLTYDTPRPSNANSIISIVSAPEVPERRKKRENMEYMKQNSLYENWTTPHETNERPSKSTILEFDPLNMIPSVSKYQGVSNELLLLQDILTGDTYGAVVSSDSNDEIFDFGESDYFNPPTPPERSDSLFSNESEFRPTVAITDKEKDTDRNSNWYVSNDKVKPLSEEESRPSNSVIQKFSHILKLDNVLNKSKQTVQKVDVVLRPAINSLPMPYYSGMLTRIVSGGVEDLFKNSQMRYCVLFDQKMMCYTDPTNATLKEAYTLDNIYSVQIVLPLSSSATYNSYCFEISVTSSGIRGAPRKVIFSSPSASERRNWVQKIAENLTTDFPTKYASEFTRCGWCYLKEGVSCEWRGAWVMLVRRVLVYQTTRGTGPCAVDLRKTRCVVTQEADEESKKLCPSDCTSNLVLDCPHATLYLRFPHDRELKGWRFITKMAAHNNGAQIHHQQLTKEDVPALVDKCVSFVYAHGSLSEGIYRRAGSSSVMAELLARFRRDAWSVQLSPGEHSEHDVAGVLKRFFRDLPEPLVPQDSHQALVAAMVLSDDKARHDEYRRVVSTLPPVARNTARKLFAHLHFVHTMAHANKMNAENLASVWAPTIMPAPLTGNTLQNAWSSKEVLVVRDLIANYERVWEPTEAESRREATVRRVLMRVLSNAAPASPKAAGDLRAWVYVHDRAACCQIALTPNKTCSDVCIELCEKAKMDSHLLTIEEIICNGSMRRIVHIDEVVLNVVLRWGYWDEEDRKDNYLLLRENKILHEMESVKQATSLVCGELKFANEATKGFKLHMFEFQNGSLCYFKDKQGSHKVDEWAMKDIVWYVGHEPKRNPQSRWAVTFTPRHKQKRSKDRPWFGCTIAGAVAEDQLKWIAAMTFAEHPDILPTPRLVVT